MISSDTVTSDGAYGVVSFPDSIVSTGEGFYHSALKEVESSIELAFKDSIVNSRTDSFVWASLEDSNFKRITNVAANQAFGVRATPYLKSPNMTLYIYDLNEVLVDSASSSSASGGSSGYYLMDFDPLGLFPVQLSKGDYIFKFKSGNNFAEPLKVTVY